MTETMTEKKNPFSDLAWNQLRKFAKSKGILAYGKEREVLEAECFEKFPDFVPEIEAPPPTKYLRIVENSLRSRQIVDSDNNVLCTVYKNGQRINGEYQCQLPMEENAQKVLDALKKID